MSLWLQQGIVALAVLAAIYAAWRLLRGRSVWGRRRPEADSGCAGCHQSGQHGGSAPKR